MVTHQKGSGKAASIPASVGLGVLIAFIWTCLSAAVTAKLIDAETIEESMTGYCSMGILLTSAILGASVAQNKAKLHRIEVSTLTAAGYYLTLLAMTALFFGGQYTAMGVTALLILGGSMASAVLGAGKRGSRNKKYYGKRNK